MIKNILHIIDKLTNVGYKVLKPFVKEELLKKWKFIHICHIYRKHDIPIPSYFIGTHVSAPSVTTNAAENVSYTAATGSGNITNTNSENASERGFAYSSTNSTPTTADSTVFQPGSFGTGVYTLSLTGLDSNKLYYIRAYAINSAGTGYGTTEQFTTLNASPSVTTNAVANISYTTATLSGSISATGSSVVERGFYYATSSTQDVHLGTKTSQTGTFGTGNYTASVSSLNDNQLYSVKAYASNSSGITTGSKVEFTTLAYTPEISLITPNDTTFYTQTPALEFSGTIGNTNDLHYEIEILADEGLILLAVSLSGSIHVYNPNDFSLIQSSSEKPHGINYRMCVDSDNYIYIISNNTTGGIIKYEYSDMETPIVSASVSNFALEVENTGSFIYTGGTSTSKRFKSTFSTSGSSAAYGGNIQDIKVDNNNVYVCGLTAANIKKYDKNLNLVATSSTFTQTLFMELDGDNILLSGNTTLYRLNKSDFSTIHSRSVGGTSFTSCIDGDFIYVGTSTSVVKLNYSDLTTTGISVSIGTQIHGLLVVGDYIYVGTTSGNIHRYIKSSLEYVDTQTLTYGGTVRNIKLIETNIFNINKSSEVDDGFTNTEDGGDTAPFTKDQIISYTLQTPLDNDTYSWRVRVKDSTTGVYSNWTDHRTFNVNYGATGHKTKIIYILDDWYLI